MKRVFRNWRSKSPWLALVALGLVLTILDPRGPGSLVATSPWKIAWNVACLYVFVRFIRSGLRANDRGVQILGIVRDRSVRWVDVYSFEIESSEFGFGYDREMMWIKDGSPLGIHLGSMGAISRKSKVWLRQVNSELNEMANARRGASAGT